MSGFVSFFKPMGTKLAKALTTRSRQKAKAAAIRHAKLEAALVYDALRRDAYKRDGGRCRVSGQPLLLFSSNPFKVAHLHHVIFRSAGGQDELSNVCIVSPETHDAIHRHVILVDGNAEEVLTITTRDDKTGVVLDVKRSPCPA